jgi:hypothetical protein
MGSVQEPVHCLCQITGDPVHPIQFNVCPDVTIDGVDVPLDRLPKILGITFNTLLCFNVHVAAICAKASQRLNILSAARTLWGHDKETLLIT